MTRKCDCVKCVHCKQIVKSTSIFRVSCKKYGDDKYIPSYCDKYLTEKEYIKKELEKQENKK